MYGDSQHCILYYALNHHWHFRLVDTWMGLIVVHYDHWIFGTFSHHAVFYFGRGMLFMKPGKGLLQNRRSWSYQTWWWLRRYWSSPEKDERRCLERNNGSNIRWRSWRFHRASRWRYASHRVNEVESGCSRCFRHWKRWWPMRNSSNG